MNYFLIDFFDAIDITNGNADANASANGINKKNVTKYHATLFNPLIDNTFNIKVINNIYNISIITSSLGILTIPINNKNNDNDK